MKTKSVLLVILFSISFMKECYASKIVTIFDSEKSSCLSKKAELISMNATGLKEAKIIADKLINTLAPKMPAAGLAAPQINISKQIFIFSWDRSLEHMQVAINPQIIKYSPKTQTSWESCFSTMQENGISKAALVTRHDWLIVEFTDLEGKIIRERLDGFAAKVFQHEYDHLQGIENTSKKGADIKSFADKKDLTNFMKEVKKSDSVNYIEPTRI